MPGVRTARSLHVHALWRKPKGQAGQQTRISNKNPWQNLNPDDWIKILTASAVFDLGTTDPKDSSCGRNMVAKL